MFAILSLSIFYLCQLNFEQSLVGIISSWFRLQFFLFSTARKTQEIHSLLSTVSLSPSLVLPCTQRCSFSHSDSSSHHAADTHSCSFFSCKRFFFVFDRNSTKSAETYFNWNASLSDCIQFGLKLVRPSTFPQFFRLQIMIPPPLSKPRKLIPDYAVGRLVDR